MTNNELKMGMKVESEHKKTVKFIKDFFKEHKKFPTNAQIYESISNDHLLEDKKYYTKLKKYKL